MPISSSIHSFIVNNLMVLISPLEMNLKCVLHRIARLKKKNSLNIKVIHEKQNKLSLLEHNQEESWIGAHTSNITVLPSALPPSICFCVSELSGLVWVVIKAPVCQVLLELWSPNLVSHPVVADQTNVKTCCLIHS